MLIAAVRQKITANRGCYLLLRQIAGHTVFPEAPGYQLFTDLAYFFHIHNTTHTFFLPYHFPDCTPVPR